MKCHGIAAVGLVAVLAIVLGGCGLFTKTGLETGEGSISPRLSIEFSQEGGIEGVDYECIDKQKDASSPPPHLDIDKTVIIPKPLCPPGKVPQAKVRFDNHPKGRPLDLKDPNLKPVGVTCYSYPRFGTACYDWSTSDQWVTNYGAFARLTQHSPAIDPWDGRHSVAEIYVGDFTNAVEVGWRKAINDVTRLFVFWWKDGLPQCYNRDCEGYVQVHSSYYPGMPISTSGDSQSYAIRRVGTNWWVYYKSIPMGYYPDSLWNNQFTSASYVAYYGEVASIDSTGNTTTDMGNGLWPSNSSAARIDDQRYWDSVRWRYASTNKGASSPERYDVRATSSRSMRYGGPGCILNC